MNIKNPVYRTKYIVRNGNDEVVGICDDETTAQIVYNINPTEYYISRELWFERFERLTIDD